MNRSGGQYKLFDQSLGLPNGLLYRPDFITEEEEEMLIAFIQAIPLTRARVGEYTGKRRVKGFGWGWDYKNERFIPGPPLPKFLGRFARKIAKWLHIPKDRVVEALVNEYTPGTALGWHRDNEKFEHVVGISLSGWCHIQFRPLKNAQGRAKRDPAQNLSLELEPRSAYVMQNDVRWRYQHRVASTKTLRYSITFRTLPSGYRR